MNRENIVNWAEIILSPAFVGQMTHLARLRFTQEVLAEEAVTYAIDALSDRSWVKLSGFKSGCLPSTYALTITSRLFEDFSRKRFGRPRPPSWVQALGQGWVKLWRMMCLERQWPEVIKTQLALLFEPKVLAEMMLTIQQRLPNCGKPGFAECSLSELGLDDGAGIDTLNLDSSAGYHDLDTCINQHVLELAYQALEELMCADRSGTSVCPSNGEAALSALTEVCTLSNEDKLLLSLTFEDGLSSRKVAELTGQSPSQVQRRLAVIKQSLKAALGDWGIDGALLQQEVSYEA